MKQSFSVIIPAKISPFPSSIEVTAAQLLVSFFKADVKFVPRDSQKSADLLINRKYWELKSITGSGKRTIQHSLHRAIRQSCNVIIDARFTKMHIDKVRSQLQHELRHIKPIKRLVLIEKNGKVVELFR